MKRAEYQRIKRRMKLLEMMNNFDMVYSFALVFIVFLAFLKLMECFYG